MKQLNRAGYTLVEVITTAAIIASLASIAGSNVFVRSKVNMIVNMELVKQELKEIGRNMVELYSTDNSFPADIFNIGNTPPETAITASLNHIENKLCYGDQSYINGYSLTVCPDDTVKCGDRCFRLTDSGTIEEIPVGAVVDPPEDVLPPEVDPVVPVDPPVEPEEPSDPGFSSSYPGYNANIWMSEGGGGPSDLGSLVEGFYGPPDYALNSSEVEVMVGDIEIWAYALMAYRNQYTQTYDSAVTGAPGFTVPVNMAYMDQFYEAVGVANYNLQNMGIYLTAGDVTMGYSTRGGDGTYAYFTFGLETHWMPDSMSELISWADGSSAAQAYENYTGLQNSHPAVNTAAGCEWFSPASSCKG